MLAFFAVFSWWFWLLRLLYVPSFFVALFLYFLGAHLPPPRQQAHLLAPCDFFF